MTEFVYYLILAVIILSMIVFIPFKPWWKYVNLTLFVAYISTSLYAIFSDPIYDGFVPTVLTIILMLIHFGVLFLSLLIYKGFVKEL